MVRYEHDGSVTVLADQWQGKPLNAPNDAVVHPHDGGIWFTDPGYGSLMNYEGHKGKLHIKEAVYRVNIQSDVRGKVTDGIGQSNSFASRPNINNCKFRYRFRSKPNKSKYGKSWIMLS